MHLHNNKACTHCTCLTTNHSNYSLDRDGNAELDCLQMHAWLMGIGMRYSLSRQRNLWCWIASLCFRREEMNNPQNRIIQTLTMDLQWTGAHTQREGYSSLHTTIDWEIKNNLATFWDEKSELSWCAPISEWPIRIEGHINRTHSKIFSLCSEETTSVEPKHNVLAETR